MISLPDAFFQVKITVLLQLPSSHEDLFQLSGELLSSPVGAAGPDGVDEGSRVLASAKQTYMPLAQVRQSSVVKGSDDGPVMMGLMGQ